MRVNKKLFFLLIFAAFTVSLLPVFISLNRIHSEPEETEERTLLFYPQHRNSGGKNAGTNETNATNLESTSHQQLNSEPEGNEERTLLFYPQHHNSSGKNAATNETSLESTSHHQPLNNLQRCLERRGTDGYWFIDDDLSRKTFYRRGTRSNRWAKANPGFLEMTYVGNQYNWRDMGINGRWCRQVEPVTFQIFCKTVEALKIKRIMLVGDSLAMAQRDSLFALMGTKKIKVGRIKCPPRKHVQFYVYRQNLGPNFNALKAENFTGKDRLESGRETPFCNGQPMLNNSNYCPWHTEYNDHQEKTLLVLNQGAHFHSVETFSNSIDEFVRNYNAMPHPGDIVVYRATVPGHKDCFNQDEPRISPLNMTYEKFLDRYSTTNYDWNLFDTYNRYAKTKLQRDLDPRVTFHYLNVYNMTVLRPDQHSSAKDCLHYSHPGPIDFWNHLLFTNLADMIELQGTTAA
eukprot:scaffold2936_cov113-Cylindrotheca_fusiformis.AAC.1